MKGNEVNIKQIYTLSTGVKFSVKQAISTMLVMDIMDSYPDPEPPMVEVTVMGGRKSMRENYADPNYQDRVRSVESKRNVEVTRAIMRESLQLESPLPDNDEWLSTPRMYMRDQIDEILSQPGGKEYLYLRYRGAVTKEDFNLITSAASVTEGGVQEKVDTFQDNA